MNPSFAAVWLPGVATLMVCVAGCAEPDFYQMNGIVTHNGKPMPYLQITMAPDAIETHPPSLSVSDENGKFEMRIGRRTVGVKPGTYTVHVEDPVAVDGAQTSTEPDYLLVIDKYGPEKSALKMEVNQHLQGFELKLD